jgi:nucleoside-diphosphate-sugar epimerase
MRIFLTGGTGFIGSHYLAYMANFPFQITALRRHRSRLPCVNIKSEPVWLEKSFDELDESDLEGYDVLVHLASVGVSPKKATWQELIYWNVSSLARLLDVGHRAGVRRFVLAGSSAEYGISADNYDYIPVDAPLLPTSSYAASKAAGCVLASTFAIEAQIEMTYLRVFSAFGEGQYEGNFWPALRAAAISGMDFPMTLGEQIRDYIPVEDVAASIHFATVREDLVIGNPKIVNVASGCAVSMRAFAEHHWKKWGATGSLQFGAIPYRQNEQMKFIPKI